MRGLIVAVGPLETRGTARKVNPFISTFPALAVSSSPSQTQAASQCECHAWFLVPSTALLHTRDQTDNTHSYTCIESISMWLCLATLSPPVSTLALLHRGERREERGEAKIEVEYLKVYLKYVLRLLVVQVVC